MSTEPIPPPALEEEPLHSRRTLRFITLVMSCAATALLGLVLVYQTQDNPWEIATVALFALFCWSHYLMLGRMGMRHGAAWLVVFTLCTAVLSVLAYGSIRTASNFLFVGAVVGAGLLLGRRALVWCVLASVAMLAVLAYAEGRGWLRTPDMGVSITAWFTQTAALAVAAAIVYHARRQLELHADQLQQALALRRQTEQERDRHLNRFARIFQNSPMPMIAQSGHDGRILDINPAFERCYGYHRDEVIGQADTMLWGIAEERQSYLKRLFRERRAEMQSAKGRRRDGSLFDAAISSEMGSEGEDQLVITTIADMTEERRAVEQLRRSEERFAKAFNFSPLNMSIIRLSDGRFLEVSQARDARYKVMSRRLLGRTTIDAGIWRDEEERLAYARRLQEQGHLHGLEHHLSLPNGREMELKSWSELIDIDGEPCALTCTLDITQEKRRERLLREIAEGLVVQSSEDFFGAMVQHLAHAIEADRVMVCELVDGHTLQELATWRDGALQAGRRFDLSGTPCERISVERRALVIDSQLPEHFPASTWIRESGFQAYMGYSMQDDDGSVIGLVCAYWCRPLPAGTEDQTLFSIFTSRAHAELLRMRRDREIQALNESLERRVLERTAELNKLNAELDSFAYSVSHDLKSPLRSINGFTQLLRESMQARMTQDDAQLLDRVVAATHRMEALITDLLALARVSQGPLERRPVDLSALAHGILAQLRQQFPSRRIQARVEPGLTAFCDARLVNIALENLLSNAVKYTQNQPEAAIHFGQVPGTGTAEFPTPGYFVRDNGMGFDMAWADKLFKPFQRLHMPEKRPEGAGIGLATVHRIIERHGGEITGEGRPGQGAEFRFTLAPHCTETGSKPLPAVSDDVPGC